MDEKRDEKDRIALPTEDYSDLVKLYGDVSAGIRETDAVSFKLLGLVPVVSGGGATVLSWLLTGGIIAALPTAGLALLAALSTFGVYRWELRNIQTCNRLWARAALLEGRLGFGELSGREDPPRFFGMGIGKTQAERVIYLASMAVWLVPVLIVLA